MKYIKLLIRYWKHKNEIEQYCGYAIKEGYADDSMNWQERLAYWERGAYYEPDNDM